MTDQATILLVHQDAATARTVAAMLVDHYRVQALRSIDQADRWLLANPIDMVITGRDLLGAAALEWLRRLASERPDVVRVLLVPEPVLAEEESALAAGLIHHLLLDPPEPPILRETIDGYFPSLDQVKALADPSADPESAGALGTPLRIETDRGASPEEIEALRRQLATATRTIEVLQRQRRHLLNHKKRLLEELTASRDRSAGSEQPSGLPAGRDHIDILRIECSTEQLRILKLRPGFGLRQSVAGQSTGSPQTSVTVFAPPNHPILRLTFSAKLKLPKGS